MPNPPKNFSDPVEVREFVKSALKENPNRVKHVLEIATRVRESATALLLPLQEVEMAECAALLHDIGYWKPIALTGFHPADGANFLKEQGRHDLASMIIGHSCSPEEGELLGYSGIQQDQRITSKLITYWDVQIKQGGEAVSYQERLADILQRYGPDSLVGRANLKAKLRIEGLLKEVGSELARQRPQVRYI